MFSSKFSQFKESIELLNFLFSFINNSFGQKNKLASQHQKRVWKAKQQKLSPQFTIKLSDVIVVEGLINE